MGKDPHILVKGVMSLSLFLSLGSKVVLDGPYFSSVLQPFHLPGGLQ